MKNKDLPMAITMMVIWIILFAISFTFKSSGVVISHTTAAFFPRVVLVVAMFFTLILIIQTILKGPDKSVKNKMDKASFKRVTLSMVAAAGFGLGSSYIGTFVSMFLFIIAVMLVWGVKRKRTILLNAIITPILIYLIFKKVLLVQLPAGILM